MTSIKDQIKPLHICEGPYPDYQAASRYTKGTRGVILTKAAVRTTWVESPVHIP
jgi:hypothetical protein